MTRLEVRLDQDLVGHLTHDGATNRFSFDYTAQWREQPRSFPVSPRIPLEPVAGQTAESHSAEVRLFFENLLPEGAALDHAAQANGIARSNLVGLMVALGKETAGALRVAIARDGGEASDQAASPQGERDGEDPRREDPPVELRRVTREELSERIRRRTELPFSVWDGKVRLSIAGLQDKIAILARGDEWFLVDGPRLASTVIVKPAPTRPRLAGLPGNEYLCMQLALRSGLEVATTRLVHVPEPVLLVTRFDRVDLDDRVQRLHLIDGCQALGLPASMKYERPYGDNPDVRDIRDGANYAGLFALLAQSPQPARDRQALLRWAIFQVLIGNTDAHGKNVSFFCNVEGLRLAPAYDLVCIPGLRDSSLNLSFAMAIGDAFQEADVNSLEWANFARDCRLPPRMVSSELERLALRILDRLSLAEEDARRSGVPEDVLGAVRPVIQENCRRHAALAGEIPRVPAADR